MKQRLWFQHSEDHMQHIEEGGLDVEGQLHALLSAAGAIFDGLLSVGIPEAVDLCSPTQDYCKSCTKTLNCYDSC